MTLTRPVAASSPAAELLRSTPVSPRWRMPGCLAMIVADSAGLMVQGAPLIGSHVGGALGKPDGGALDGGAL